MGTLAMHLAPVAPLGLFERDFLSQASNDPRPGLRALASSRSAPRDEDPAPPSAPPARQPCHSSAYSRTIASAHPVL